MPNFTPNHVVTAASSFSKWQLARQHPGKYALTREHGHWLTRYVSDDPGVAIAEAWRHHLKSAAPNHWCLIDRHAEAVFFMQVRGDVVRQAKLLSFDELDTLTLKMSDAVYLTPAIDATDERWSPFAIQAVAALTQKEWQGYTLKKSRAPEILAGGGAVLMVLIAALWLTRTQDAPALAVAPVVDDYQSYRQTMSKAISASQGAQQALHLAALAQSAPPGWVLSALTLKHDRLIADLKREDAGRLADARHWSETLTHVDAVLTPQSLTLSLPLTHTLKAWATQMSPFEASDSLLDTLTQLGWRISDTSEHPLPTIKTLSLTLEKDAMTLDELATFETLVEAYPLSLTALQMTPRESGQYHATLHLTYTGENQ
ncbi:hypothetical protein AB4175_16475 [Vibrio cyclitrophicus]